MAVRIAAGGLLDVSAHDRVRLARVDELPPREGRSIAIDGEEIAVFRCDTAVRAVANECPHAQGPLADGIVAGDTVTCPLHGRTVDLVTGEISDWDTPVHVHHVMVEDGVIFLVR